MRSDVRKVIFEELRTLVMERTRDQFGRAWAVVTAEGVAGDVAMQIEKRIVDLVERATPRDVDDQAMHAKLQRAWHESALIVKKTGEVHTAFCLFVRKLNAAFERRLF